MVRLSILASALSLFLACHGEAPAPRPEPAPEPAPAPAAVPSRASADGFELLGLAVLPSGFSFEGTEVGGLSALAYDRDRDRFLALSDDRGEHAAARFYSLRLKLDRATGLLPGGALEVNGHTVLRESGGEPFVAGTIDPEGLALSASGTVFISSEGDSPAGIAPFVREQARDGSFARALAVPEYYLPHTGSTHETRENRGVRRNLGFEALTLTPDGTRLFTGTENALFQDGDASNLSQGSPSRVMVFTVATGEPIAEYLYWTDPVVQPPVEPDGFHTNGLVEALALDAESLLTLERSYSAGRSLSIRLFRARIAGADNLLGQESVADAAAVRPISKRQLLDLSDLGLVLDNVEGMAFGPSLADGRSTLILVSDNNFSERQMTQVIALAFDPSLLEDD